MKLIQSGTGKTIGVHNPILFFAQSARRWTRPIPATSSAFPITACCASATRCRNPAQIVFTGIPNFAPEILRRVRLGDPMKQKHLARALDQPRRRRRDAGLQARHRHLLDRRRGRPLAARRFEIAAARRIRPRRRTGSLALRRRALDLPPRPPIWRSSSKSTAAAWRPTATARRCSSPRARGNWATSPRNSQGEIRQDARTQRRARRRVIKGVWAMKFVALRICY